MKKYILAALAAALLCIPTFAQNPTAVTGTILDPNSVPYYPAQVIACLTPNTLDPTVGGKHVNNNIGANYCVGSVSTAADGSFALGLFANANITPAATQWIFTVQTVGAAPPAGKGSQSFTTAAVTISGSSQSVTSSFTGLPALLNAGGSSSPSPGTFNSTFDPPLFQCYSAATGCLSVLSATGAQAAIDLRANPIDTHTIKFSPIGTVSTCQIQVDSSADGVSWNSADVIPTTLCTSKSQATVAFAGANFIRVNLTTLSGGGTLNVVYSGRLAPAASNGNTGSVSNGQWVQAGEIIWYQYTTQANLGTHNIHASTRMLLPNGSVSITALDPSCNLNITSGVGFGFSVTQAGWLQSATTYMVDGTLPQGSVYINIYILNSMPAGGNGATCSGSLVAANIGTLLAGQSSGSFYPVSFVGTTAVINSPWSIPGFTVDKGVGNPSAGAEFSTSIGGGAARTCIQGLSFQLTTSATVANRLVSVRVNTGSTPVQQIYMASTVQPASTTVLYSFAPGTTATQQTLGAGATVVQTVPFNNGQLFCGTAGTTVSVSSFTGNLQAGDQFSLIDLMTQVQQDNN